MPGCIGVGYLLKVARGADRMPDVDSDDDSNPNSAEAKQRKKKVGAQFVMLPLGVLRDPTLRPVEKIVLADYLSYTGKHKSNMLSRAGESRERSRRESRDGKRRNEATGAARGDSSFTPGPWVPLRSRPGL